MKKIALVTLGFMMILFLTGCGKKSAKLECIQKKEGFDTYYNVGFLGKKVESIDFIYKYDLRGFKEKSIEAMKKQDFCEVVKSSMEEYKNAFKECKYNFEPETLIVSASLDIDKIASSAKEKMASVEEAKVDLEQQGYTCTIVEEK